jgi:hypothetical protein
VRFAQHSHFVNLSRVSPLNLYAVFTAHDYSKAILHANQRIAICLSPILVVESHLLTATDRGLKNKFIKGLLHEQEMQRFVGATCMAFGHGSYMRRLIETPWYSAPREIGNPVRSVISPECCFINLLDAKPSSSSSSARYLRTGKLLSKSPEKPRAHLTKQILDVTDRGEI